MYFNLQICVHLKRLQNMIVHGHVATLADAHIYIVGRSYMYELFNWLAKKLVTRLVALLKAPLTVLSHVRVTEFPCYAILSCSSPLPRISILFFATCSRE